MRIAIFDVGTRNFAMIIEHPRNDAIKAMENTYKKLPDKDRIKEGRPHSEKVSKMLSSFYTQSETEKLELFDPNQGSKEGLTDNTRRNLFQFLEKNRSDLRMCKYIAIEEQFYNPRMGVINKPALLLAESCYTWLLLNVPNAILSYTPSRYKTALLACPKESLKVDRETGLRILTKWEKSDRKKWSIEKAKEIYEMRGDSKMIEYIDGRKGDDVSDCLLMSIAFVLKTFVMSNQ